MRDEPVPAPAPGRWHGHSADDWTSSLDRAGYTAGVRRIREHIAAGEVYQVNFCRVLTAPTTSGADVDALTALLARGNPAPYAGTIRLPDHGVEIATVSPALFLRRTGRTEADLLDKDYAENVMIVDLVRNDPGRVCVTGSVSVPDLCAVEKHPGLVHLVSTGVVTFERGRRARVDGRRLPARFRHRRTQVERLADHRRAGSARYRTRSPGFSVPRPDLSEQGRDGVGPHVPPGQQRVSGVRGSASS